VTVPGPAPATPVAPPASSPPTPEPAPEPPKGTIASKLLPKTRTPEPAAPAAPAGPAGPAAPEPNPEDKLTLYADQTGKAAQPGTPAAQWAELKTITKGLRDQLNAARETERSLKADLENARKGISTPDSAEIEKLRAEHKAMSDRLMLVDLREHPKFQAEFITPQQTAVLEAQAILDTNGVSGVKAADLLAKPRSEFGRAVSEAAKPLAPYDQTEFAGFMRTAFGLKQQAEQALSKSREIYGAIRTQTTEQQKSAFQKTWEKVSGSVAEHLVELEAAENSTPEQKAAVERYNTAFRGIREQAEQIAFGATKPEEIAANSIKAAAYDFHIGQALPKLLGEYDALLRHNAQMASQLNAILDRNPNRQGTVPTGQSGGPADSTDPRNMDHHAAADHFFKRTT
jgi:hypothetical protein